ncbi:CPBP family intramembrane glutamic endopeptidase [Lentzea flava]|uniref:CPBP family intramembrane glutamic endopeptidase n=1 Tax=Lentzea flava TaxID=103732 RepID=UPI0016710C0F|nr:type II CAAX endopeptidase family protein [Lentzea flava]
MEIGLFAVLFCAFVLAFTVLAYGLAAAFGVSNHDGVFADPVLDIFFGFGIVAVTLPAVLLAVRWAGSRPSGTVSAVDGGLRWAWLFDCARWAAAAISVVLVVGLLQDGWESARWPGWGTWAQFALIAVLVVPLQATAEEYLCRGWLLQVISSWTRLPWPAAVLTTALFVMLHDYTDPLVLADLAVFSFAMCWLTVRTGGLEAAIALHVANNATGMLVATTQGIPSLDQSGDYTVAQVLPGTVTTLAYAWWVDRRARSAAETRVVKSATG